MTATAKPAGINELSARILRVHAEPFEYVREADVHEALTADPTSYLEFLEGKLSALGAGRALLEHPSKMIFTDPTGGGDFRVMPCVLRSGSEIVKTVKIVGTNLTEIVVPDQVTVGKAFRLHPDDNHITHIFEACLLSSARTGACAAIAVHRLAPRPRRVGLVGSGRVAYYSALYIHAVGGVEEILVSDTIPARAHTFAEWGRKALPGATVKVVESLRPDSCDVFVYSTTSTEALCRPEDVTANLVISLGADSESQRELSSDWASVARIYVDVLDSCKVGDLRAWIKEGVISPAEVTDLVSLFRDGTSRSMPDRRNVFISTGSAMFDNLTIAYFLDAADQSGSAGRPGD
jgi:ornithine cyclodeaminase/alanine dehydrogenase-like protein (mu-crystallin family)